MPFEQLETILTKIKDNAFDIRGHFNLLFNRIVKPKKSTHHNPRISISNQLIDEGTLSQQLEKTYPGKAYVIFFYAHKPHNSAVSPFYPEESPAHTSVLLCTVKHDKIEHILNIDGYNFIGYVDLLGERAGAKPNPHIQQRLVIQALGNNVATRQPLQSASWRNMNCVLYAFAFVETLLNLFETQSKLIEPLLNLDSLGKISLEQLSQLEGLILEGLIGKYVKKEGSYYVRDDVLREQYHQYTRRLLAYDYQNDFELERQVFEAENAVKIGTPKPTSGFISRFVNLISMLWEGVKSAATYVGRSIGLVK